MARTARGLLTADLGRTNPWWGDPGWAARDPQLCAAASAPFVYEPATLADITPPNLYTLRGPRRVGKSTAIKQTIARLCCEVDPRRVVHVAADMLRHAPDLTTILQAAHAMFPDVTEPRYVFVDEVSTIEDWHLAVKWLRDNTALAFDCVVASGSSAADVAAGTESLAGRRGPAVGTDRLLLPMAFPEFVRCAGYPLPDPPRVPLADFYAEAGRAACRDGLVHLGTLVDAFDAYLATGGFPQAIADLRRTGAVSPGFLRDLWDVVQSDLRRAGVSRPEVCLWLLERLVHSTCAPVSFRKLGDELGIDQRTAAAWVDALANAYLAVVLFKEARGVPDVNSQRKVYLADPVLAALPETLAPGAGLAEPSQLAQTVLASALFRATNGKAVDRFQQPRRLFYHATRQHAEVDFLILPERAVAESKYVDVVDHRDGRAMRENFGGGLLLTHTATEIEPGLTFVPAPVFCWLLDQPG